MKIIYGAMVCAALIGCDTNQDDSDNRTQDQTFQSDDLAALPMPGLTAEEVLSEINHDSNFYANDPNSDSEDQATSTADDEMLKQCEPLRAQKVEITGNELNAAMTIDVGAQCPPPGWDPAKRKYNVNYVMNMRCPEGSLAEHAGKSSLDFFENLPREMPCKGGNAVEMRFTIDHQMVSKSAGNAAGEVLSFEFDSKARLHALDGTFCTLTDDGTTSKTGPCVIATYNRVFMGYEKARTQPATEGGESRVFMRVEYPELEASRTQKYYSQGSFKVTVNNWTGEVINRSETEPPLIVMSNGKESIEEAYMGYAYGLRPQMAPEEKPRNPPPEVRD